MSFSNGAITSKKRCKRLEVVFMSKSFDKDTNVMEVYRYKFLRFLCIKPHFIRPKGMTREHLDMSQRLCQSLSFMCVEPTMCMTLYIVYDTLK